MNINIFRFIKKVLYKIGQFFNALLMIPAIRFYYVKLRYKFLRRRMTVKESLDAQNIWQKTVSHNLSAFETDAVFGCGGRMGLLYYPIIPQLRERTEANILVVGCRSEDDIFWLKSYGFNNVKGLDLFSYSKYIDVGDIHHTNYKDGEFDAVLLGWMISYSSNPQQAIDECVRITKRGGMIGVGIEHEPVVQMTNSSAAPGDTVRGNSINNSAELLSLFQKYPHKVVYSYDHEYNNEVSLIVRMLG